MRNEIGDPLVLLVFLKRCINSNSRQGSGSDKGYPQFGDLISTKTSCLNQVSTILLAKKKKKKKKKRLRGLVRIPRFLATFSFPKQTIKFNEDYETTDRGLEIKNL